MPTVYLSPIGNQQFVDTNGNPLSGGKIYSYSAGSTAARTTYTDSTGATPQANPIILNSVGRPASPIWLQSGQTKLVLYDNADNLVATWDNVSGINDVSVSASEWQASGLTPTYISATSFSFSGDQTATYQTGRRLQSTVTGGTAYSTVVASSYSAGITTITVVNDGTPLDSGLTSVYYGLLSATNPSIPATVREDIGLNEFRITLTSGSPVTPTDVTAATTIYVTPYRGNRIALYNGSTGWIVRASAEMSISVPASTNQMYDLFCYDNGGTPTLEALAWTNDTTRATALTLQNGVYVKSGATTRRYLGSFRTTGVSGQTEDSEANRLLFNAYNRVVRKLKKLDSTASWSYTTATWRSMNNSTANRVAVVAGLAELAVDLSNDQLVLTGGSAYVGFDVDGTTDGTEADIVGTFENAGRVFGAAKLRHVPAVGYHYYQAMERGAAGTTFHGAYGITSGHGITGTVQM